VAALLKFAGEQGYQVPPKRQFIDQGRDGKPTQWVLSPTAALVVKLVFRWYTAEGLTTGQIAKRLNAAGTLFPKGGTENHLQAARELEAAENSLEEFTQQLARALNSSDFALQGLWDFAWWVYQEVNFSGSDVFCGLSTSVGNTPLFWGYFCGNNPENVQFLPHNGAF